jgi:hypothetical protein
MNGLISTADLMVGDVVVGSTIRYCWVDQNGTAKWFFLAPMLLSLTVNVAITMIVFQRVRRQLAVRLQRGDHKLSSRASEAFQGIKLMITVASVTGVGWLVAVLVLFGVGGVAMQYVFTVLNAFQGCVIFAVHIVQKEDGRAFFASVRRSLSFSSRTSHKNKTFRMDRSHRGSQTTSSLHKPIKPAKTDGISESGAPYRVPWLVTRSIPTSLATSSSPNSIDSRRMAGQIPVAAAIPRTVLDVRPEARKCKSDLIEVRIDGSSPRRDTMCSSDSPPRPVSSVSMISTCSSESESSCPPLDFAADELSSDTYDVLETALGDL